MPIDRPKGNSEGWLQHPYTRAWHKKLTKERDEALEQALYRCRCSRDPDVQRAILQYDTISDLVKQFELKEEPEEP